MEMSVTYMATMVTTTFSCGAGMDVFWIVMSSAILRRLVKVCGCSVVVLFVLVAGSNVDRCLD